MATKAEREKARAQLDRSKKRTGTGSNVAAKRAQRSAARRDRPGSKYATGNTATRNRTQRTERKASWVLEDSAKARPSRKSTRKASNRIKPDANLHRRQTRRVSAPKSRATRSAAGR